MITLSDFIGEIVDDISKARSYADYGSAILSEKYFADPFIKGLPIPHYTIDDVEVEVPVMVVGIKTNIEDFEKQKIKLVNIVAEKLPNFVLRTLKYNYYLSLNERTKKEKEKENKDNKLLIELKGNQNYSDEKDKEVEPQKVEIIPKETLNSFLKTAKEITISMANHVSGYLQNYNYDVLKLLDLTDDFKLSLTKNLKQVLKMDDYILDLNLSQIEGSSNYVSNLMFFEFKNVMKDDFGVQIDPNTSQMNEFSAKFDCLMHIKMKIREQDLNLIVEDKDGKARRYLSLT